MPARSIPLAVLLIAGILTARSARATAGEVTYDLIGTFGVPALHLGIIAGAYEALRHTSSSDQGTFIVVVGGAVILVVGSDIVGLKLLGDALNVPTSWASAAAGVGVGIIPGALGGSLVFSLANLIVEKTIPDVGFGRVIAPALALCVSGAITTILVSKDPFHLAPSHRAVGTVNAPLLTVTF